MEELAHIFKALSEPLRLRILFLLLQRESLCVCDLVTVLDQGQSTVSRHLAYLKHAGVVHSRREGSWMHYQLTPKALSALDTARLLEQLNGDPQCRIDLSNLENYELGPRNCSPL